VSMPDNVGLITLVVQRVDFVDRSQDSE
jgi:hypothetical protein